jgi:hypothetical protein
MAAGEDLHVFVVSRNGFADSKPFESSVHDITTGDAKD